MNARILVIDDELDMLDTCQKILERAGHSVSTVDDAFAALEKIRNDHFDIVLADLKMPGIDGMQLLKETRGLLPCPEVIIITAHASVETAIAAVRQGAFDYVAKPFTMEQLERVVQRCLEARETGQTKPPSREAPQFELIVTSDPRMRELLDLLAKISKSDANVLVVGESGTGKELVARSIHQHSPRRFKTFVPIDGAALPEPLLESELFGYEKGAFTGAETTRKGLLEYASGGTFFLDEVGNLSQTTQAKLLRVLEDRRIRRVGGREWLDLDLRFISATNRSLEEMVRRQQFREDLFYRLNVVSVRLPPLRDRMGDIPLLARHFVDEFRRKTPVRVLGLSSSAELALQHYSWPGNIRELRNTIERAMSLGEGNQITLLDLPAHILTACQNLLDPTETFKERKKHLLEDFEREYVRTLLSLSKGNVAEAARKAGMRRTAFYRLLQKHHVHPIHFRTAS